MSKIDIGNEMKVVLLEYPTLEDWLACKQRCFVTIGKATDVPPTEKWKKQLLEARHSPIRRLHFSFYIECPYWVSTHLARHVHAQPYIKSQRNDRQDDYDRTKAPQDAMVCMIYDLNAEALMTLANKRLCNQASKETRTLVQMMCDAVVTECPEFEDYLVPQCEHDGGICHEMYPCNRNKILQSEIDEIYKRIASAPPVSKID